MERANIIQSRLNDENAKLAREQVKIACGMWHVTCCILNVARRHTPPATISASHAHHRAACRTWSLQERFQRSQREGDLSTEEYEKYCTEAMFRIQVRTCTDTGGTRM